uniref:Uncharacterized protein n=3 Tax=unclassified Arthrobacter TaxID=235627 RepID=I3W1L2_9MICC|nr:hypothetical protein [Arthrobacter sp. 31.31]AFK89489.1 hypothetical protein [Arthrobacter sp. J3.49]AFK89669.1 hypothetical protein [Arthrobacter sp. J3.53]
MMVTIAALAERSACGVSAAIDGRRGHPKDRPKILRNFDELSAAPNK